MDFGYQVKGAGGGGGATLDEHVPKARYLGTLP